jgi:hypothetical protein
MNWKTDLKLNDLDATTQFEMTCKRCRHTRTLTQRQIMEAEPGFRQFYIDEVEASLCCPQRGCRGGVKLDMLHDGKEEGFVGGLA